MSRARILLLLVAIVAGGIAAFLATRGTPPETIVQQVAMPATSTKVLVAKQPIGVGERLSADSVAWQDWPESAVRPEYITSAKSPDAPTKIAGAVARFEIFTGEPILDSKLVHSNQGFLSAVLDPGMRGVSVNVAAPAASGGFIIPNDRVDVIVTDNIAGQASSRVLLSNVKVLAINTRLGQTGTTGAPADPNDPKSQIFAGDAIATLELTPAEAETLITATSTSKISLTLRSVADFGGATKMETAAATPSAAEPAAVPATMTAQTIRIVRFGRLVNVTAGSADQGQATVAAAAYAPPATTTTTTTTVPVTTTTAPATPVETPAQAPAPAENGASGSNTSVLPGGAETSPQTSQPRMAPTVN